MRHSNWALCMLALAAVTVMLATFIDIGWLWFTSCSLFLSWVHPWDKGKCMGYVGVKVEPFDNRSEIVKCSECALCLPDTHAEGIGTCHNESPYLSKHESGVWPIVQIDQDGCAEGIRKPPEMTRDKWPFDKRKVEE